MTRKTVLFFLLCLVCSHLILALPYHIRRIDSRDGLSNSAVLSLYQDKSGFLWIGTYNGLNRYDGKFIKTYSLDENNDNIQSSNIIENIQGAGDNCLWLSTYIGLNKFSKDEQRVTEFYPEYRFPYNLTANDKGLTCLIARKNYISVYEKEKKTFTDISAPSIDPINVTASFFDPGDRLWIFTNSAKVYKVSFDLTDSGKLNSLSININEVDFGNKNITSAFEENGLIYYLDNSGDFYIYDTYRKRNSFIRNIKALTDEYGTISSIVSYHDDFILSFKNNGVLKLVTSLKYKEEVLSMNVGVFCLKKDDKQDIVWIGFDGKGLGIYNNKPSIFNTILSASLPTPISKPIRCVYTDKNNTLWIGSKGDGLTLIKNYDRASFENIPASSVKYYTTEDGLSNNQVFVIKPSKYYPVNWLGTEGPGLSCYSLEDDKIYTLKNLTYSSIQRVHSIVEQNDSTLWVATAGYGLLKVNIEKYKKELRVTDIKTYFFNRNNKIVNDLFSMCSDDNGNLWIGSRGDGVIRFKTSDESYEFITSGKEFYSSTDDILTCWRSKSSQFYFGSCAGLLQLDEKKARLEEILNPNRLGMKEMIHGLQEDEKGFLWMGTNRGIEKYNPNNNIFYKYLKHTGLNVIEFSDNADYTCPYTQRIFFGGVDGIVWIEPHIPEIQTIEEPIYFTGIKLNGINKNLNDYIKSLKDDKYIELTYRQNTFSISFVAIDYMYGMDMQYSYRLKEYNDNWVNANDLNEAQFTSLPPGNYTMEVKFRNDVFETESPSSSIQIVILPPWYLSTIALFIYILLALALLYFIAHVILRKAKMRREAFNKSVIEKNKEELYQAKMKFFSNITHEFLTPLTLMQGPCERILSYENSDRYVKHYTEILSISAGKLHDLVKEIISFSKSEDLNYSDNIECIHINDFIKSICLSFSDTIERNNIDFTIDLRNEKLMWNSSPSSLSKILMNLVSNAFKYTPNEGKIKITSYTVNNNLVLKVYNTGAGLTEDEIAKVFDRYTILENMDKNAYSDYSSRNGLGLSICYNAIQHLNGNVTVKSEKYKFAEFIVELPPLPIKEEQTKEKDTDLTFDEFIKEKDTQVAVNGYKQSKPHILIVDDNKDIVWMVAESLSDKYEVLKAFNAEQALNLMKNTLPHLIIADIIMPGEMDGMDLVKTLKTNPLTRHIPVIIISAKASIKDQMQGVEYGADMYLTKPFNLAYLNSIIEQLIKKEDVLREYYNSPISSIGLNDGRLIHQNDQDFLIRVTSVIDDYIESGDLRPEQIAEILKMSPQSFYRKLKGITTIPPRAFIKKYRFSVAAKLLITTNTSVQEIMYKVGINNRSYFYREFSKQFDSTPKEFRDLNKNDLQKKQENLFNLS